MHNFLLNLNSYAIALAGVVLMAVGGMLQSNPAPFAALMHGFADGPALVMAIGALLTYLGKPLTVRPVPPINIVLK